MSSHYESERRRCRTPERRKETNNSSTDRDRYRGHRRSSSPSHSKIPPRSKEKERVRDRSRSMESRRTAKGESSRKHVPRRTDRSPTPDRKVSESKKREERSRSRKRSKSKVKKKSKEHKKRHKKKRSSSSSDSSSSESSSGSSTSGSNQSHSELKLLHKLEANRLKMIEEKQKQKELIKANETPEEKRARRLAKKRLKERGRRARAGWHSSHQGYTDHDNPFGDAALTDAFVWGKKLAKLGPSTATPEELERINRQTQIENKIELEKVAARRAARAAAGEAEADGARAREDAHYSAWAALEHAFHLQQARLRSHIRVRDQRAKPIDLLAWYISSAEAADALHMHEPYTFLQGLSATDLDDLLEDIKVYMELEGGENAEYWRDVLFVVQDERRACRLAARPAVHASVADHCTQVLRNKSGAALEALALEISARVANPRPGLDVSYWESLLTQLQAHMARARLRDLHQRNLRTKLDALRHEQGLEGGDVKAEGGSGGDDQAEGGDGTPEGGEGAAGGSAPPHDTSEPEEESAEDALEAWRRSGYSPPRVSLVPGAGASTHTAPGASTDAAPGASTHTAPGASTDAAPDTGTDTEWARVAALVVSEREDEQRLAALRAARCRRATNNTQASGAGGAGGAEVEAEAVLQRAMVAAEGAAGGGGARFGGELVLGAAPPPAWTDKYRPRKPRYFNRVHTGFEWNKYNQTHYDMDNPPPKIVQGYKFNIFYPELIDKGATPAFSLKPCPENSEFAILRFSAGPPYEDIAFKIVNREWEYSYKRGFRCHFHNNIFQLWFHFKRYRYRR